jgi:hypothetical protein
MAKRGKRRAGFRTAKGNITAAGRRKYGMKGSGRYPIHDARSASSALRLRGHTATKAQRANVINRAARFAPAAAKQARKNDKAAGKL